MTNKSNLHQIDPNEITPREFYERYVRTRTPVLLSSIRLKDSNVAKWRDLEYLRKHAGNQTVQVERKVDGTFGSGKKRQSLSFSAFLDRLESGETDNYMTTQYSEEGNTFSEYCQQPLSALISDFPSNPDLLPTLVPQQVNLWMGASTSPSSLSTDTGTSSGLHHDFADNLYILLRGRKRFTLFPPTDAKYMYTYGKIRKVYPNGHIVYSSGAGLVRDDGAYPEDVMKWTVEKAETRLKELKEQDASLEMINEAELELEEALDTMMLEVGLRQGSVTTHKGGKKDKRESKEPPSFSKIPVSVLHSNTPSNDFPNLKKATRYECIVEQGQMLYLPTGWFHEVTSFGSFTDPYHMAFNYWFHPPTQKEFEKPYEDDYWMDQWMELKKEADELRRPVKVRADEAEHGGDHKKRSREAVPDSEPKNASGKKVESKKRKIRQRKWTVTPLD